MRPPFLTLLLALSLLSAHAEVKWLSTVYDFGTWHEVQGKRTGYARFVNTGPDEVIITGVRPSCGCTGADFYKEPVAAGDTAWVSFTYDPTHRPGRFEKTVKVYTDPGHVMQVITIHGTVIGTPESLRTEFPVEAGPMRMSALKYNFGDTPKGTPRHGYLTGYNQSGDTIYPRLQGVSEPLQATIPKNGVAPGEAFTIGFYLPTRTLTAGAHSFPVEILAGKAKLQTTVNIDVLPLRAQMSETEMAQAPHVAVPTLPVELSGGKPGGKIKFKFPVRNTGKTPLHIERVYSRASAVTLTKVPRNIKAGATANAEGYIDLSQVDGPAYGFLVEVISSDPLQPSVTVRLTGQTPR